MFDFKRFMTIILLTALPLTVAAQTTEVHAVGVYEGNERTDGRIHGPEVKMEVDRPGQDVTLVLGSYEAVRFLIEVDPETRLRDIYVHGYNMERSEVFVNGDRITPRLIDDLSASYKPEGSRARGLIARLSEEIGIDRLASFHGDYTAPETPFRIEEISGEPRLQRSYLGAVAQPDLLPESLRAIVDGTADLPVAVFTDTGFALTENGETREFPISLDVPTVSWPVAAAYDARNQRIYGASKGGEGYLYVYDIAAEKWSVASSMNQEDAMGIVWDDFADRLIIMMGLHRTAGLMEWRPDTGFRRITLNAEMVDMPGYKDLFDPGNGPLASLVPLAVEGDNLLVLASNVRTIRRPDGGEAKSRTYLLNLSTGAFALVAYAGD